MGCLGTDHSGDSLKVSWNGLEPWIRNPSPWVARSQIERETKSSGVWQGRSLRTVTNDHHILPSCSDMCGLCEQTSFYIYIYMYIHIYYMYIHIYYMYIHIHYMYIHTYKCVYIYIHTHMCIFIFFNVYLFLRERESAHEWGRGRERRSKVDWAWHGARTHKLWDHDLSWSWTLNQLSHRGTPNVIIFYQPYFFPICCAELS